DNATAMKLIEADHTVIPYGLPSVLECDILSRLRHPNLVHSLSIYNSETCKELTDENIAIAMPLYSTSLDKILLNLDTYTAVSVRLTPEEYKYELSRIIKKLRPIIDINWFTIITILHDLARGTKFLHDNNILHLDIKLENCLLLDYHNPRAGL